MDVSVLLHALADSFLRPREIKSPPPTFTLNTRLCGLKGLSESYRGQKNRLPILDIKPRLLRVSASSLKSRTAHSLDWL